MSGDEGGTRSKASRGRSKGGRGGRSADRNGDAEIVGSDGSGGPPDDRTDGHGARARVRVITMELAQRFAEVLLSDLTHTVESASAECGLKARSVRQAISRYDEDDCGTDEDEAICGVLARAKERHLLELRRRGFMVASDDNRSATSWHQWQLEVQDPRHHSRKSAVELTGAEGGPIKTQALSPETAAQVARAVLFGEGKEG